MGYYLQNNVVANDAKGAKMVIISASLYSFEIYDQVTKGISGIIPQNEN